MAAVHRTNLCHGREPLDDRILREVELRALAKVHVGDEHDRPTVRHQSGEPVLQVALPA